MWGNRPRVTEAPEDLPRLQGGARGYFQAEGGDEPHLAPKAQCNLEHLVRGHLPGSAGS